MGREFQTAKTFARLKRVGEERGLSLDSEDDFDAKYVYYRCERDHRVQVKRSTTYSPHWAGQCDQCVYEDRLAELTRIAESHGGRLVSRKERYKTRDWVTIECRNGHQSKKRVYAVLEGTWCAECHFDSIRITINDARQFAKDHGGECLSTSCEDGSAPLRWRCRDGYEWTASLNAIRKLGYFGPGRKIRISPPNANRSTKPIRSKAALLTRARDVAISRGGHCLSTEYINHSTKMEWECSEGHRWFAPANSVLNNGAWCNICAMKKRPGAISLEFLQEFAESKGGKLLSKEYVKNDVKLRWQCADGYEFERSWMVMRKAKNFCPTCRD